jgi:uncharacterized protein YpiB (UPF0302 family)
MRKQLKKILRRRRMRFLKWRAHRSAQIALEYMRSMEADLHELHVLNTAENKLAPLTLAEIESAVEGIG